MARIIVNRAIVEDDWTFIAAGQEAEPLPEAGRLLVPLGLWQAWANDVRGHGLEAGHFFPEEMPEETAAILGSFFLSAS